MRIIHLVSNKEWGGGERYVLDMAMAQKGAGHDVIIACRPVDSVIKRYVEAGLKVVDIPLKGYLDMKSAKLLRKLIGAGPSVMHAHNFHDAFIALRARDSSRGDDVKVIMTRHLARPGKKSWRYRGLYKDIDAIICVSELVRDRLLSSNPPVDYSKLIVIHNSINIDDKALKGDHRLIGQKVNVMWHGRVAPEKGLETLIEAVRDIDSIKLTIAGSGDEVYVESLKSRAGDNVEWIGFRSDIHSWIEKCDIGVLPSIVSEAMPLSVLEYMSHGRPVIATDNGGQRELIEDGRNGLLVPPGDVEALRVAIMRLVASPAAREEMGACALCDFNDKHSYQRFFSKMTSLYNSLFSSL